MRRLLAALAIGAVLAGGSAAQAGAVGGPKSRVTAVGAFADDRFEARFAAGELALVLVKGDGGTDLDLYVYDENGNLVASDTDDTDACVVSWVPRWTGRFIIRVVNRGAAPNIYAIQTN